MYAHVNLMLKIKIHKVFIIFSVTGGVPWFMQT